MKLATAVARRSPRTARGALLASALVSVCALVANAGPAAAQDTTYIGGGGGPDGQNIIVNMDAIDGGTAPSTPSAGGGGDDGGYAGELVPGPAGAMLRFPPRKPPRSRLTVDPTTLGSASSDGAEARRPALTPPGQAQDDARAPVRTAKLPPKPPHAPTRRPAPDAAQGARDTAQDTAQETAGTVPEAPATSGADAAAEETMRAKPDRKPRAPEPEPAVETADGGTMDGGTMDGGTMDGGMQADAGGDTAPESAEPDTGAAPSPPPAGETAEEAPAAETRTADTDAADTGAADTGASPDSARGAADAEPDAPAEPDAARTQTANLPDGGLPEQVRLDFAGDSAELGDAQKRALDAIAERLKENERQRIQLKAFASGGEDNASRARRLSLSRALAVRSYLIDQGIRSTRMDVRALGNTAEEGPLDRVDIVPARR